MDPSGPQYIESRSAAVHSRSWRDPFGYLVKKLEELVVDLVQPEALTAGQRVLDYGCATQPYRHLFAGGVEYLGADLPGNPLAAVVIDPDGRVPLPDGSVDLVLSSQVLEHVADPGLYLAECLRLLKPGGVLALSTHGIMYFHPDPDDYWRWTVTGLEKVVTGAGFEVERMEGVLGLASAGLQLFLMGSLHKVPRLLRRSYNVLLQGLIAATDRRYSRQSRLDNGLVIGVRARKPVAPPSDLEPHPAGVVGPGQQ